MDRSPRAILHVDMDAFFASVEQLYRPELRGRPVIVGGHPDGRGVVSAASYEARRYGIHSAMPLAWARQRCPEGVFLPCDGRKYAQVSDLVFRVLGRFTPDVEAASVDEAYLDVTGCGRLFGPPLAMAHAIRQAIDTELGLSASVGVAASRCVAKVASDLVKPAGVLAVLPGQEASFLAPLPVGRLPGVGPTTARRLTGMGIRTLGDLARLEPDLLDRVFGAVGPELRRRALGLDDTGLRPPEPRKSMGREVTFQRDVDDRGQVSQALAGLAEGVCRQLRREGLAAGAVTVKLRYADFQTVSRVRGLPTPTQHDSVVIPTAWAVLRELDGRRAAIRLVGVTASRLRPAVRQPSLFDDGAEQRRERFYQGLDRIRDRFGGGAIGAASRL